MNADRWITGAGGALEMTQMSEVSTPTLGRVSKGRSPWPSRCVDTVGPGTTSLALTGLRMCVNLQPKMPALFGHR